MIGLGASTGGLQALKDFFTHAQITHAVKVEGNHVYVIPPTKNLETSDGQTILKDPQHLNEG